MWIENACTLIYAWSYFVIWHSVYYIYSWHSNQQKSSKMMTMFWLQDEIDGMLAFSSFFALAFSPDLYKNHDIWTCIIKLLVQTVNSKLFPRWINNYSIIWVLYNPKQKWKCTSHVFEIDKNCGKIFYWGRDNQLPLGSINNRNFLICQN